jgi:hypothetical protein
VNHFDSPFIQGLYNWQTAIGAAVALLGAVFLWLQIRDAKSESNERRTRRFAAARATLPHILSEIINYLESAMEWMCDAHAKVQQQTALADPPPFPTQVIESLERMIEATTVDEAAKACTAILSELQTFRSRIGTVSRASRRTNNVRVGLNLELEDYMIQAADIHRRVELLYPFARAEQDQVPDQSSATYLFKSLSLLGCSEVTFGKVYRRGNDLDKKRQSPIRPTGTAEAVAEPDATQK